MPVFLPEELHIPVWYI